ncbi:IS110 family transposase [Wukongibacter sp. M2B1]|uniref:IS110 family transposase n=1 Tax=Wukongibacter sp. M2B1 TaxID=3088895 RepID=UPI003D798EDE
MGVINIYYFDFISVGIDIGSKVSWASIITPDHKPFSRPIRIDHQSIESLEFLVSQIKKAEEVNSLKARIFLESTGIYHIPLYCHLKESGFEVSILNPLITDSNKNQGIRKVKSDKKDALRIAKTAYTNDLKTSLIPSDVVLNVRSLVREYHKLADDKTSHVNQLTKELAIIFPGYNEVFSNTTSKTSIAILKTYRTPKRILATPRDELIDFIRKNAKKGLDAATKTYNKLINAAKIAITFSHQLRSSYDLIELQLDFIEIFEKKKTDILNRVKDYLHDYKDEKFVSQINLLRSINGVGFISAVSIMAEIGDFSAFTKPKQLVAYFGIDPSVKESGKFKGTKSKMSKRGSAVARRVLFIVALASIRRNRKGEANNPVLRKYYDKKQESKAKKAAIGALMRKITNIIFAVLRNNREFVIITPQQHIQNYNQLLKLVA